MSRRITFAPISPTISTSASSTTQINLAPNSLASSILFLNEYVPKHELDCLRGFMASDRSSDPCHRTRSGSGIRINTR